MKNKVELESATQQFLLSKISDETRRCYKLLASLDLPVNDRLSLEKQLSAANDGSEAMGRAIAAVTGALTASDFPLASAQNALEKFDARIRFPDFSRFFPPLQWWTTPQEVPERDTEGDLIRMFGPRCGRRAYEVFLLALRSGIPEPGAYAAALAEGRRC